MGLGSNYFVRSTSLTIEEGDGRRVPSWHEGGEHTRLHIGGSSERVELNMKNKSEPLIYVASPPLSICLCTLRPSRMANDDNVSVGEAFPTFSSGDGTRKSCILAAHEALMAGTSEESRQLLG